MPQNQNFESHIEEAKTLLSKLSDPQLALHDGIAYYKQGMEHLKAATDLLEQAKLQIIELDAMMEAKGES